MTTLSYPHSLNSLQLSHLYTVGRCYLPTALNVSIYHQSPSMYLSAFLVQTPSQTSPMLPRQILYLSYPHLIPTSPGGESGHLGTGVVAESGRKRMREQPRGIRSQRQKRSSQIKWFSSHGIAKSNAVEKPYSLRSNLILY